MDSAKRCALITGATGFIGSHLARKLVEGKWTVHVLARPNSSLALIESLRDRIIIEIHDGTIESLARIVETARPEIVFHLASLFLSQHRGTDILPLVQANVGFGTQLLEAMAQNNCGRFINTGTAWQHYENRDYSPVNLYAATKQAFEAIVQYYVEAHGLQAVTLELCDTYGPGDPRKKLLKLLREASRSGEFLPMSPGEQEIDLVHVDDVVEAYMLAAEQVLSEATSGHRRYTVSSGSPLKLRELVRKYEQVTGRQLRIEFGARPYRDREVMRPWERGQRIPGWEPKTELADGIRRFDAFAGERA
ncbi:MAG TPA: NAD-dependent epimerase/dehydratase family protein [Tepidisphaeraceae bacterium]|jgi:nucleoside-diphosphate-sugar epimerase